VGGSPYAPTALSPEFYEGIGRVITMAAALDHLTVILARGLAPDTARGVQEIHSQPGGPLRELRRVLSQLPSGQQAAEVRAFLSEATTALHERNRVTHSLHTAMFIPTPDGEVRQWSLHPREGVVNSVPTVQELADLINRLRALVERAAYLTPSED
jgi:hypothetical protein